jgi:hypothetical protein
MHESNDIERCYWQENESFRISAQGYRSVESVPWKILLTEIGQAQGLMGTLSFLADEELSEYNFYEKLECTLFTKFVNSEFADEYRSIGIWFSDKTGLNGTVVILSAADNLISVRLNIRGKFFRGINFKMRGTSDQDPLDLFSPTRD